MQMNEDIESIADDYQTDASVFSKMNMKALTKLIQNSVQTRGKYGFFREEASIVRNSFPRYRKPFFPAR